MHYIFLNQTKERSFSLTEDTLFVGVNIDQDIAVHIAQADVRTAMVLLYHQAPELSPTIQCNIQQHHQAKNTLSSVFVRALVPDQHSVHITGAIHIDKQASLSDASFEVRGRLLGKESALTTIPALEILPNDVRCHHSATISQSSTESLWYAAARGLSQTQATDMLNEGLLNEYQTFLETQAIPKEMQKQVIHDVLRQTTLDPSAHAQDDIIKNQ